MSTNETRSDDSKTGLGFLDSLTRIFRGSEEEGGDEPEQAGDAGPAPLEALSTSFEAAVGELRQKVEELRSGGAARPAGRGGAKPEDREAARERRMVDTHVRIRGDIEQMHAQLGTGLKGDALEPIIAELEELEQLVSEGRSSHELLPRVRFAIGERIRMEAGELAVERLRTLLERADMPWPDPTRYDPGASEEQVESSRRRRMAETREAFLAEGFLRTAQRSVGIVSGWGSNYPDPASPLWQECVLEGVGSGIRGELARAFVEVLRSNRDEVNAGIEELIGGQVEELRRVLGEGVRSLPEANRIVASALQAVDQVVPEAAWKYVCEREPRARGKWSD